VRPLRRREGRAVAYGASLPRPSRLSSSSRAGRHRHDERRGAVERIAR